jgi:isoquinoline 1-oxidoreductase alpha subunit
MIISALALLQRIPRPTEDDIRASMNGNICRCGTYSRIIAAVQQAAGKG